MDLWEALQQAEDQPADEKASRAGAEAITQYIASSARKKALLDQKRAEVFRTALRDNPQDLFNMESEASRSIDDAANGNPIGVPTMGIVKNDRLARLLKDIGSPVTQPWKASPTEFLLPIANEVNPIGGPDTFLNNMRPRLWQINGARVSDSLGGDASVAGSFERSYLTNKLISDMTDRRVPPTRYSETNRGTALGLAGHPNAEAPGGYVILKPNNFENFYKEPRGAFNRLDNPDSPLADPVRGIIAHEAQHIADMHRDGPNPRYSREGSPGNFKRAYGMNSADSNLRELPFKTSLARQYPEQALDIYSAGHHSGDFANTSFDSSFAQFSSALEAIADGQNIHPDLMKKFPTLRKLAEARGQKEFIPPDQSLWSTLKNMRPDTVEGTKGDRVPRAGFMDEAGNIWRQRDLNWLRDALKTNNLDPVVREHMTNVYNKLLKLRDF